MENNQHNSSGNAAAERQETPAFSNSQPGQQLPAESNRSNQKTSSTGGAEQHSESSKPENENETLGTP